MSARKRKYRNTAPATRFDNDQHHDSNAFTVSERDTSPGPVLYVQAYEADIIRGPQAASAAASLETPSRTGGQTGSALIKWGRQMQPAFPQDEDTFETAASDDHNVVWVDRYDARLLLDALPTQVPHAGPSQDRNIPDSPGGWSDLPSDTEDVFFLSPEEVDDFRRNKKRRHIDHIREERLKARRAEDGESSEEEQEVWGGSDEEPDNAQRDLMQRTATHLLSSPNPAQLEARILANHGSDARFAFLRGRWSHAWQITKGKARMAKEKEQQKGAAGSGGLGVLAGYGDSDAEDSEGSNARDDEEAEPRPQIPQVLPPPPPAPQVTGTEATMEARRARAKEWAEKRRQSTKGTG
ncbi:hypothetical protein DXG01_002673 [Tephrocybe rancida]|nr:hypothetical protein DXG01_002673 [Tephrocybe rancida]